MKQIFLTILVILLAAQWDPVQGQKLNIDSLTQVLSRSEDDTAKVSMLISLAKELRVTNKYDLSLNYADQALSLSQKIQYKKGIAAAYDRKGVIYKDIGESRLALENHKAALKINHELKDNQALANSYNNISQVYVRLGNYAEALKNNFESLKIGENSNNRTIIARSLNNIGDVYRFQGNYSESLKNHLLAFKIAKELSDKKLLCSGYNYIGSVYALQGHYPEALNYFTSYYTAAEQLGRRSSMAEALSNIGCVYENQKLYSKSLINYTSALKIHLEQGNKQSSAICFGNLGSLAVASRKYDEARDYYLKGLNLYRQVGSKSGAIDIYLFLSKLDSIEGNTASSFSYFKLYSQTKDSILNEESNRQISQLKIQYETEKKDKDLEIQSIRLEKHKSAIEYIVIGFIVLLIFTGIYFRIYNKKKKNEYRHKVLETEMKALRSQMNPHFTFNVLNSIQYYIGGNDMKSAELYLNKFSSLIRMILDQSRNAYITLGEELRTLRLYLELEQMLFEKKFSYEIHIQEGINPDELLIPGMLIQPIIENAIKHGLEHKRGEAFITVNFSSENTILTCTVTDNGIGREQSEQRNKSKSYKSVSSSIIKERIQALSIIYNIQLHYATSDLYSEDGKPAGTLVSIQMPIGIKTMSDHFQN